MKGYNDIVAELLNDHPQILKHIKSNRRVLILKIIMVEIAIAVIAYALRDRQIAMLCFCILAGIGAPILFLKPFRYFKGGYSGCIERVEVVIRRVDVTKEKAVRSDGYRAMQDRAFIVCDIITDNGKKKQFSLEKRYEKVFRKGDEIVFVRGLNYPINMTPENYVICPLCGNIMPSVSEQCVACGNRIVRLSN